ncbi:CDP-alcohol phosphatidyltransferase family protein [uncultured Bacteroides sp.]|uniref:CDP-alcohol phosphatidyltransferase family protein n=1 Tax=uncultured Bacteroides sp. TaxID=162156 RepID=UPI002AA7A3FB|nr:CDP-alcohol phosphatidyltransferase family protein [uncultured Bacteroides sp.]
MEKDYRKKELEASLKSLDTEEFIDIHFYRPIGYRWALFFNKLGVTPNSVTIASIFLGVAAGILFYYNDIMITLCGIFLLIWANSYDSADGQLARLTGQKSELGRILDGTSGDFWFITIYASICLRLSPEGWGIWIWVLAAVTGFFHSKQAAMADYYRNVHLFFLKGKAGSELDNSVQQRELYKSLSWKNEFIRKLFIFFYKDYTASQEKLTPKFQLFFKKAKEKYGDNIPQDLKDEFRVLSKPLMKYTNILSFNTRIIVLFIGLLINEPWIYFIFEITVLNILLIYMIVRHESFCMKLYKELS